MASTDAQNRTILVSYGTVSGNAQEAAEELGRLVKRLRFSVRVTELNDIRPDELLKYAAFVIIVSTTGQGDIPGNAALFMRRLRSKLPVGYFSELRFASFGIGDSSYPQFNWAHRKLNNRLRALGAVEFHPRGESDEQAPDGLEGQLALWLSSLKPSLSHLCPLPGNLEPIPDDTFLEPDWSLSFVEQHDKASGVTETFAPVAKGLPAELVSVQSMTPEDHWQAVCLFEFATPKVDYCPGDTLTVYPKNLPEDVNRLIQLMNWETAADKPVKLTLNVEDSPLESLLTPPIPNARVGEATTLRHLLTNHLDITAVPRRSFFAAISHFASNQEQKERLVEFTDINLIDELYDYTTRARRSILEVLQEFDSVKIPLRFAVTTFPMIRGRLFSIASGGDLKQRSDGRSNFQLLVAIVKYRTVIRQIRHGLCTRYLKTLQVGDHLIVRLSQAPQMRADFSRPAIMIGPGTGVAPLRSMIYERLALDAPKLPQVLVFGCRNKSADYFFASEWSDLESASDLNVMPAFSRDQKDKVYVQDMVRRNASVIFRLLKEGVVYVCGSSGKMPAAVREAIIEVIQVEGDMSRAAAEASFEQLQKEKRYQQETW